MATFTPEAFVRMCEIPLSQMEDHARLPGWNDASNADPASPSTGIAAPYSPAQAPGTQTSSDAQVDDSLQQETLPSCGAEVEPLPASPGKVAPTDFGDLLTQGPDTGKAGWHGDAQPATQAVDWAATQAGVAEPTQQGDYADFDDTQPAQAQIQLPELPSQHGNLERSPTEGVEAHGMQPSEADRATGTPSMFKAISRMVTGIFKRKGDARHGAGDERHVAVSPQTPSCPAAASLEARLLERAASPPGAAEVKQGLGSVEQVHQLGGTGALHVPLRLPGELQAPAVVIEEAEGAAAISGVAVDEAGRGHPDSAQDGQPAGQEFSTAQEATGGAGVLGSGEAAQRVVIVEEIITETVMVAPAVSSGAAAEDDEGRQPRRKRRKLLTGMAVVWKHFGLSSTDATACEGVTAIALPAPPAKT